MEKTKEKNKSIRDEFCSDINELKIEYNKIKDKYELPEFSELNKLFDIEDVDVETEFLLRKIRRTVSDRIAGYIRFVEIILNPSNAPIFFYKLIRKLDNTDKEILTNIYETIGKFEFEVIELDLDYSEKNEGDFIKRAYNIFNDDLRTKLLKILKKLETGEDNNKKETNGSYFG